MPRIRPVPEIFKPSDVNSTVPPMRVKISLSASPGCVVDRGQSRIVISPPLTSAIDMNGAALDKSGSITRSCPLSFPGSTRHCDGWESSTIAPNCRSIATVISICGCEGSVSPICFTVIPSRIAGPTSRRAETN